MAATRPSEIEEFLENFASEYPVIFRDKESILQKLEERCNEINAVFRNTLAEALANQTFKTKTLLISKITELSPNNEAPQSVIDALYMLGTSY